MSAQKYRHPPKNTDGRDAHPTRTKRNSALLIPSMNLGSRKVAKASQRYAGGFPDSQATGVAKIRVLKIKGRKFHTSIQQRQKFFKLP
ncbi:hypothetical protein [Scytonema sp. PCC 10023]|uniref:hypothetical protein n=1 Tax=Scytonema sp. PCC 10023 TaxID=1680591 RepID=UPI0039C6531E